MKLLLRQPYANRVMQIALPAIAGMSLQMVVSIIETAMIGRLTESVVSLAAMVLGVLATWVLTSFFSSLATGTHILAARRYGEGNYASAGAVLNNSLLISFCLGILFGGLGFNYSYEFIRFFPVTNRLPMRRGNI
jgi:Na+-driven multidrug efflux pump